jgi:hypothetical protein
LVNVRTVRDINIFDRQNIKDFGGSSPTYGVGQVVVANEEEDWDAAGGQAIYAFGKFPLLSLTWLTSLIGITAKENKVYLVFQGIVNNLVKGRQEVKEACG